MSIIDKIKKIFTVEEEIYENNRNHPRVPASMKVTYSLEEGVAKDNIALLNRTKNVSAGGICLIIYEKLEKDTPIYLDIVLSDDYVLKVQGNVAWQSSFKEEDARTRYETGIRFVDMDPDAYYYLTKYIAALSDSTEKLK